MEQANNSKVLLEIFEGIKKDTLEVTTQIYDCYHSEFILDIIHEGTLKEGIEVLRKINMFVHKQFNEFIKPQSLKNIKEGE